MSSQLEQSINRFRKVHGTAFCDMISRYVTFGFYDIDSGSVVGHRPS